MEFVELSIVWRVEAPSCLSVVVRFMGEVREGAGRDGGVEGVVLVEGPRASRRLVVLLAIVDEAQRAGPWGP